jgi:EF hand
LITFSIRTKSPGAQSPRACRLQRVAPRSAARAIACAIACAFAFVHGAASAQDPAIPEAAERTGPAMIVVPPEPTAARPLPPPQRSVEALNEAFRLADTNQDMRLSREEAAREPANTTSFDQLDGDSDGFLSAEEFSRSLN